MPGPKDPPRDRDSRETKQPPPNVLAQIRRGRVEREDPTPIGSIPSPFDPERPVESRAQVGDIDKLRKDLGSWVSEDKQQHDAITGQVSILAKKMESVEGKIAIVESTVAPLPVALEKQNTVLARQDGALATQSVQLATLIKTADLSAEDKREYDKAMREASLDDQADTRKRKRELGFYVIRGVLGIAIAVATSALTLLIEHALK